MARTHLISLLMVFGSSASAAPAANIAYKRLLCAGRAWCEIAAVTSVAPDVGTEQVVVGLFPEAPDPSFAFDGCRTEEFWLVTGTPARPTRRQLLASGYSGQCASVGDSPSVSTATFDYSDMVGGGHPDHYTHDTSLTLAPLGYGSEHDVDAERFPATNVTETTWDWPAFAGAGNAGFFLCDADGNPTAKDNEPSGPTVHWSTIPALPKRVAGVTHLGACAVAIDGAANGFTLRGKPGNAVDASFRTVIAGNELLVEVTDDHWLPGDHLEISFVDASSPQVLGRCEDLKAAGALQWNVRVSDGAVTPGAGHPTQKLAVKRSPAPTKDGDSALLTISLPAGFDLKTSAITVAYSDTDDGKAQKRLFGTSELQVGKRWTIGHLQPVPPRYASCIVKNGSLEPQLNRSWKPDEALVGAQDDSAE